MDEYEQWTHLKESAFVWKERIAHNTEILSEKEDCGKKKEERRVLVTWGSSTWNWDGCAASICCGWTNSSASTLTIIQCIYFIHMCSYYHHHHWDMQLLVATPNNHMCTVVNDIIIITDDKLQPSKQCRNQLVVFCFFKPCKISLLFNCCSDRISLWSSFLFICCSHSSTWCCATSRTGTAAWDRKVINDFMCKYLQILFSYSLIL